MFDNQVFKKVTWKSKKVVIPILIGCVVLTLRNDTIPSYNRDKYQYGIEKMEIVKIQEPKFL